MIRAARRCSPARPAAAHRRTLSSRSRDVLHALQLEPEARHAGIYDGTWREGSGAAFASRDKATGEVLGHVVAATRDEVQQALGRAREAFAAWRLVPAPRRGEVLRQVRERLAARIAPLGALVSLEMGKPRSEGVGEVQEFVDMADLAVGNSRSLAGSILPSERPGHTLQEAPHPLGLVGVISAFNFRALLTSVAEI